MCDIVKDKKFLLCTPPLKTKETRIKETLIKINSKDFDALTLNRDEGIIFARQASLPKEPAQTEYIVNEDELNFPSVFDEIEECDFHGIEQPPDLSIKIQNIAKEVLLGDIMHDYMSLPTEISYLKIHYKDIQNAVEKKEIERNTQRELMKAKEEERKMSIKIKISSAIHRESIENIAFLMCYYQIIERNYVDELLAENKEEVAKEKLINKIFNKVDNNEKTEIKTFGNRKYPTNV